MKKLNRKGFTLIELLAVIVIMAIIVVVTVPTIINTISDARVNSLWNLAKATANSYDTIAAQDMLASEKVLADINLTSNWQCFALSTLINTKGQKLSEILDLSETDINFSGPTPPSDLTTITNNSFYCSAIRLKDNGSAEVFLFAQKEKGKFSISGKSVFALSSDDKGFQR